MGLLEVLGLRRSRRGIIRVDGINEGYYEVKILDEGEEMFKIEYLDIVKPTQWVVKETVHVIS